jgi:hypothetical protein
MTDDEKRQITVLRRDGLGIRENSTANRHFGQYSQVILPPEQSGNFHWWKISV